MLTPRRKHIGKAIAQGSRLSSATECLKEPSTKKYLLKNIGVLVRNELILMCSNRTDSILCKQSMTELCEFKWDSLLAKRRNNAPVFLSILSECMHTKSPRPNPDAVVGLCSALILKHRFSKMSLVQRLISLILYSGHRYANNLCYIYFNRLEFAIAGI